MGINTYEVMYIQARDNYPFNVDECIEKLQYVIAADDEHAGAHFLMGQIYEEQLEDYKQAEYYYRMTLYLNKDHLPVYGQFAVLLINLNRLDEALKIIEAGLRVPGADKPQMDYLQASLYEKYEMYKTAIDYYNRTKMGCMSNYFMSHIDGDIKRAKDKQALAKKLKKKQEAKTGKKEKKDKSS